MGSTKMFRFLRLLPLLVGLFAPSMGQAQTTTLLGNIPSNTGTPMVGSTLWCFYVTQGTNGSSGTDTKLCNDVAAGWMNAFGFGNLSLINTPLPLADLPSLTANQVLGALTATTPSGLGVPSCSGAQNALIWTSGVGFGCNTVGGAPGGSSGQVQYNNLGVLAGSSGALFNSTALTGLQVSLGSDATGDIWYRNSSGAFTRLGIGNPGQYLGVSAGLPQWQTLNIITLTTTISNGVSGQLLFNSAGVVGNETLTSAMDTAFGAVQGSVLYRGPSTWSALGPGTAGQFFETQGAGANPIWGSPAGSGTVNAGILGQIAAYAAGGTAVSGETAAGDLTAAISGSNLNFTISANAVTNAKAAQMAPNTVKGNFGASTANSSDNSVPSCSGAGNALNYTSGTGLGCISTSGTPIVFTGTTAGTANAQTIASPTPGGFTLTDQYEVLAKVGSGLTNTGALTINVNSTGVIAVAKQTDNGLSPLVGGEWQAGLQYSLSYQASCPAPVSANCFVIKTLVPGAITNAATSATVSQAQWSSGHVFLFSTAAQTLTLPVSTSLAPQGGVMVGTVGVTVTIAPNAADSINGGSAGASVTVAANELTAITSDGAGHVYVPLGGTGAQTNVAQTWTAAQTFQTVNGSIRSYSGTTDSLTTADCGYVVHSTGTSAVTETVNNNLPAGCNIGVEQIGASPGVVTLAAQAGGTQHTPCGTPATNAQYAIVWVHVESNGSGTAAVYDITGGCT